MLSASLNKTLLSFLPSLRRYKSCRLLWRHSCCELRIFCQIRFNEISVPLSVFWGFFYLFFISAPCSHYQNFSETCRRLGISKYKGSEIPVDDQDIERVYFGSLGFQLLGRSPRVKNWCGTIYPVWIRGNQK